MVSVIIPTYNHGHTVGRAIASAQQQSYADLEIVVVNDGSPDDTAERLQPLAASGAIRYLEQPNGGQAAARNAGLALARGEYVAFLDDDDWWPEDKLAWQVAALEEQRDAVLVYGDYVRVEPDSACSAPIETRCPDGADTKAFRDGCWIVSLGQTLIRRSAIEAAGPFDEAIWGSDDWDLYLRLAAVGPFMHRRRVALYYQLHDANASWNAVRHVEGHFRVMRKHLGWRSFVRRRHFRRAQTYFTPRLLQAAHHHRVEGDRGRALRAYAYAGLFRPSILFRRSTLAGIVGTLMR
jgi:glycosyltransferase involved in cell wall biosynthesis